MAKLIFMGWGLAILMATGALAGALNTMYTSADNKAVEIAPCEPLDLKPLAIYYSMASVLQP